jgi:type I restriction enzyme S subunit
VTGLPQGWATATVGDVTGRVESVDPRLNPDAAFRYVDISSIDNSTNTIARPKSLAGRDAPSRARQGLKEGDTVFSTVRTYLRNIGYVDPSLDGAVGSTGFAVLRPATGINSKYLYYFSLTSDFVDGLSAVMRGTSYPAVVDSQVRERTIPVPPAAEQQRIVTAIEKEFSRISAGLAALERVRRLVDALIRKALDVAVGLGVAEAADWSWSTIGANTVKMDYGTSTKTSESVGVPVLRMGNIQGGRISLDSLKFLPANHPDVQRWVLEPGDLVFNRTNSPELVGKTAVYEGEPTPASFASYLVRVRCNTGMLPHWMAASINCSRGRQYIASVRSQQVGQANVSASKLARMPIQVPDVETQRRRLADLDEIDSSAAELLGIWGGLKRKADALRSSILAAAFSGRLVPQDSTDEAASLLLERIAAARAAPNDSKRMRSRNSRAEVTA